MEKEYLEKWSKRLNPKRFRGTEMPSDPGWNPFDSDFSRITMSAPFRRLQDKAQVFPLEPNDFVRTRLTHSIEVSSLARSLGVKVETWLLEKKYIEKDQIGHIPSILATASLAHDIGNPPFGHFGEECVRKFFKKNKEKYCSNLSPAEIADLTNFDGNVQGLRLLLRLGLTADEFSYNLTFPTLATVVKYPKDSLTGNCKSEEDDEPEKGISFKKYGFYQTEMERYRQIDELLELSNERHPLCFLLESADDISYSISDVEDGFKKNTLTIEYLQTTICEEFSDDPECLELGNNIEKWKNDYKKFKNKKSLIAQKCRIYAHWKMIPSAFQRFKDNHDDIINGRFKEELLHESSSANLLKFFKTISHRNFKHESVIKNEILGETVISYLLQKFITAIFSDDGGDTKTLNGKFCTLFSNQSRYAREQTEYDGEDYLCILMVIDFVASMTDSYALALYQKLRGTS